LAVPQRQLPALLPGSADTPSDRSLKYPNRPGVTTAYPGIPSFRKWLLLKAVNLASLLSALLMRSVA
jgi:hypothetical protein